MSNLLLPRLNPHSDYHVMPLPYYKMGEIWDFFFNDDCVWTFRIKNQDCCRQEKLDQI